MFATTKYTLLIYSIFLLCYQPVAIFSQCVSSGSKNPTVITNDASIGTIAWNIPANVTTSDNLRATAGAPVGILSTVTTNYLLESGFGFTVPTTASVCGIQVEIEKRQQGVLIGSSVKDNSVKILKNGAVMGSEHAAGANWPGADAYVSYGGSTDLWGTTWTPADINSANFGVAYASAGLNAGLASLFLSAEIDHIRVTIFYNNILPIELIDFSATCDHKKVQLKWATASQINNDFFTIERTKDGVNFEPVGIIDGGGTISQLANYSFTDEQAYDGISYYRLKQTDFNGNSEYFQLVSVECDVNDKPILFPNPSNGKFTIDTKGDLTIYNLSGQEIYTQQKSSENKQIDLSHQPNGIYFYQLRSSNDVISSGKLVIDNH